jgi:aldehyde dehydrogenase (NAD+)
MQRNERPDISEIISSQRAFFATGATKELDFRLGRLKLLKDILLRYEEEIVKAVQADLGRSYHSAFFGELGITYWELDYALRNLKKWMRPQKVRIPLYHQPSSGYIVQQPYGLALVIGPWNYPFHLNIIPLIGLVEAGNCGIIKPSEHSPHTSAVIAEMINMNFDPQHVFVMQGDHTVAKELLEHRFDFIFYTGSSEVGRKVAAKAGEHLTPFVLELGGKNPCIVDETADIPTSARRIVWGKYFNAGQSCVAPDYVVAHKAVKAELTDAIVRAITDFYGEEPKQSPDFECIINAKHLQRLTNYLGRGKIVTGGEVDASERYLAPTVMDEIGWDAPVMQEEIFGPILPLFEYDHFEEVVPRIVQLPTPLAVYVFSKNKQMQKRVLEEIPSGTSCINDVMLQSSMKTLPFGGVGESGVGRYHGKNTFLSFSNPRSVLKRRFLFDLPMRYPPYKTPGALMKKIVRLLS